jgi:RNA polymerase sigma-70 factor, ECF subfamily
MKSSDPVLPETFPATLRCSWQGFLDTYEPLRSVLYRYCRHLTRSPWDAEDLAQDTMARAFVTLGQMGHVPEHPKAWLFRVASNLWIDQQRRHRERLLDDEIERSDVHGSTPNTTASREAAGTLLGALSPQERAAVVLKDAFEFSIEEIAETLATTAGAVKAALHRGRGKLVEPEADALDTPAPGVLDAFCAAFNAGDIDRLTALLLDNASVEVVGATTEYGPAAARATVLFGMLFGSKRMADAESGGIEVRFVQRVLPEAPRVETRLHRGQWFLIHWYKHEDGEAVRAISRIHADGEQVARLRNYFFTPDFIAEMCGELAVPFRVNGYRWCPPSTPVPFTSK